ncbi:MAG: helix-turn-helix domain-containing protein [Guyparkeria sp.]
MNEQERREPAVGETFRESGEPGETITLGHEVSGPTVGERIRRSREAAGLSAADLAQPLNLDLKVIERIERDELDAVPGRPYILSYLRSWARQLGIDGDELIAQYNAQRVPANADVQGGIHPTLDVMEPRGGGMGRRLLKWLGILVVIAIIVFALSRLDAERVETWWSDVRGETAESPTSSDSAPAGGAGSADERPAIEGALDQPPAPPTEGPATSSGVIDEPAMSSQALPGERLSAIGGPVEDTEQVAESASGLSASEAGDAAEEGTAEAPEAAADDATQASTDNRLPVLLLRATDADSWVEVRDGDGERLMYDVLSAGEERAFAEATGPFSLVLGRPEEFEVEYRGEPVELDGTGGDTGVLRITVGN